MNLIDPNKPGYLKIGNAYVKFSNLESVISEATPEMKTEAHREEFAKWATEARAQVAKAQLAANTGVPAFADKFEFETGNIAFEIEQQKEPKPVGTLSSGLQKFADAMKPVKK